MQSPYAFRLIIIPSELEDINLKTSNLRFLLCISNNTNYSVVNSSFRTGKGLSRYECDLLLDLAVCAVFIWYRLYCCAIRIPYPLLKTDNFGCLFFFVLYWVWLYAELTITSSICFRLIIILSKLNDINLKTPSLRLLLCISYNTNYSVMNSALRTGNGLSSARHTAKKICKGGKRWQSHLRCGNGVRRESLLTRASLGWHTTTK